MLYSLCSLSRAFPLAARQIAGLVAIALIVLIHDGSASLAADKNEKTRTIIFPNRSIGGLVLMPAEFPGTFFGAEEAAVAKGRVTIKMSPQQQLWLRGNTNLVREPHLLDSLAPDAVDCLELKVAFLEEGEEGFSDKILERICRLTGLKQLSIEGVSPTDAGMSKLANLKKLECLYSNIGELNGSCLKDLQKLPALKVLLISANPIRAENLKYLGEFPKLRRVDLSRTNMTEEGMKQLSQLSKCSTFRDLNLASNPAIGNDSLKYLLPIKSLEALSILSTSVTEKGIPQLRALAHLKRIDISQEHFTPKSLEDLRKQMPGVTFRVYPRAKVVNKETNRLFAPLR
jgi:hypothetical protein